VLSARSPAGRQTVVDANASLRAFRARRADDSCGGPPLRRRCRLLSGAFRRFQRAVGERPALRAPAGMGAVGSGQGRDGSAHDPRDLRRPSATARRHDGRGGRAGGPGNDKHRRPVIDRGRAVCGSWYHPDSSPPRGGRPRLHGDGGGRTRALARCIDAITGVACSGSEHPSPPTSRPVADPPPVSGRGSRGFFAGVPDPASQRPRFSASFPPGTRPCHRQWTIRLLLASCREPTRMSRGRLPAGCR
jgi:hypothetical protein